MMESILTKTKAPLKEYCQCGNYGKIKIGRCNMSVFTRKEKEELISEGWLPFEINAMMGAKTPSGTPQPRTPIEGKAWGAVRRSRIRYITDLRRNGWSGDEIRLKIANFYRGKDRGSAVWQWLKAEYHPAKHIEDVAEAVQRRAYKHNKRSVDIQRSIARKELTHSMGYIYGRKLKRGVVRSRIPARPRPRMIRKIVRKVV